MARRLDAGVGGGSSRPRASITVRKAVEKAPPKPATPKAPVGKTVATTRSGNTKGWAKHGRTAPGAPKPTPKVAPVSKPVAKVPVTPAPKPREAPTTPPPLKTMPAPGSFTPPATSPIGKYVRPSAPPSTPLEDQAQLYRKRR